MLEKKAQIQPEKQEVTPPEVPGGAPNARLLARLYQQYWVELIKYVLAKFGAGPPEPEDAVHAAFTKLAANPDLHQIENPRAFLYTTIRNFVIDYRRRAGRSESYAAEAKAQAEEENLSHPTAERVLMDRERLSVISKVLHSLPAKQRRLVVLNRFDGLTCREIGKREGMSHKAVQKQIERALAKCLDALDAAGEGEK